MDGAATALMSGAAASRSWGHGAIQWTPSSVSARVYVHARPPAHRRVRVSTTHTDEEGRLKKSEVTLEAEATWTMWQIKQSLVAQLPNIPPERMRLIVYGAEAADEQMLHEVSPTAADVHVRLQLRRRGAGVPQKAAVDDEDDLLTAPTHDPYAPAPAPPAPPPPPPAPPLGCLHVRTMCGGSAGRSVEVPVTAETEVRDFRAIVAKLPLTLKAWHDDPSAAAAPPAKDGKEAKGSEADAPPLEALLLLGVGDDLELPQSPTPAGEGGVLVAEGGGFVPAGGEEGAQYFDGARLVHLRDGKVLGDYSLAHESVVYIVIEGR